MEMRIRRKYIMKAWLQTCCCLIVFMLIAVVSSQAQDSLKVYTVKNGKMYIWLSKNLPVKELDQFIAQFDLGHLALKRFISTGDTDSIRLAGWKIGLNNNQSFTLEKSLAAFDEINNPADRIMLTGKDAFGARFPAVSNAVVFGYNRFRNKYPFAIKDSVVTFFLRRNTEARRVYLAGSFNDWDPGTLLMTKTDSGWIAGVKLKPGKYWYKFIVDGNWIVDDDNRNNENDEEGNTNSVFYYTNSTFSLKGYTDARRVYLAGSFNHWSGDELQMEKGSDGWELSLYLAEGTHTYKYIVGRNWIADPGNPNRFPNEFNDYNSYISIGKPYVFKLDGYSDAKQVVLQGSFNGWRDNELYMTRTATGWELPYVLGPGNYEYRFIADGKWMPDPANPPVVKGDNKATSTLVLQPNYTFRLKGNENAKKVFLSGSFNNWNPQAWAMKKENGEWVITVHLSPGKHLYKFVVDGKWIRDPENRFWEENEHSSGNSVLWFNPETKNNRW